nr:DUF2637 domain-containing protein [Streptomyces coryli]
MTDYYEEKRKDKAADRAESRLDRQLEREERRKDADARDEKVRRDRREAKRERDRNKDKRKAARRQAYEKILKEFDTAGALVAMVCSIVPALYFQLKALSGAGLLLIIAVCLAVMLESGAWVATVAGERAKREGRPTWPFRLAMWGCASFAAFINYSHAPGEPWLAWVLAASSYGGVFFWELRGWGRHSKAKTARSKAQRRTERARARHDRKRRRHFPKVYKRYRDIIAAHPYGTVDQEAAWANAWRDVYGDEIGVTPKVRAGRIAAAQALGTAVEQAGVSREAAAVELLLADVFRDDDGGDGPAGDPSGKGPNGSPTDGRTNAKTLGRKGKKAFRRLTGRKAPKTPGRPLTPEHIAKARKVADAFDGAVSVNKLRQAGVGGSTEYLMRLRDHVKDEGKS